MSFWESLKDTAESIGGAAVAPLGVAWDLATVGFDDKDDNFGTVTAKMAGRAGDALDPLLNEDTWTGFAFGKTMRGLEFAYREGISEPIVTANTMAGHVYADGTVGDIFEGDKWRQAYDVAQNRSIGQASVVTNAAFFGAMGAGPQQSLRDPMDERAYKQINKAIPVTSTIASGTTDFIARWYLDPGVVVGKAAMAARAAKKLTAEDKFNLAAKLADDQSAKLGFKKFVPGTDEKAAARVQSLKSDTDKFLDWSDGKDATSIFHGSPGELKASPQGMTIAGLLADTHKIDDDLLRRDAKRRILAVAAGDDTQIARLQEEVEGAASIVDALKNMRRGTTVELKTQALIDDTRANPAFIADLERQLANQNKADEIVDFVSQHESRLRAMLDTQNTLSALPKVSAAGKRGAARTEGQGIGRDGTVHTGWNDTLDKGLTAAAAPYRKADEWAKSRAHMPTQSVFQKSLNHVPLLILNGSIGMYAKAPARFSDAMRRQHLQGYVKLHDWKTATGQLDSMMQTAGVETGVRLSTLSEAMLLRADGDEAAKRRLVDRVQNTALKALWVKHGEHADPSRPDDLHDYFDAVMAEGSRGRDRTLAHAQGQMYAASEAPEQVTSAMYAKGMRAAKDEAARQEFATKWNDRLKRGRPRVDHIDEHGTPVAMPLLEPQLANSLPLIDIDLAKRSIQRDSSYMARLARSWKADKEELDTLQKLVAKGGPSVGNKLQKAIEARRAAMDWSVWLGQKATRAWKFGVLFRVGYPIRVLMDDHMRIATQLRYGSFLLSNSREALGNLGHNQAPALIARSGRRGQIHAAVEEAKRQRRELVDLLNKPETFRYAERADEIKAANRSIGATQAKITKWNNRLDELETKRSLGFDVNNDVAAIKRNIADAEVELREKQGAVAYLSEQLGQDPDDIKKAIEGLEFHLTEGRKAFKAQAAEKRHIGQNKVRVAGGMEAPAAYEGVEGSLFRGLANSGDTFDLQVEGAENRAFNMYTQGSHRSIAPNDAGHLTAWADVINRQFGHSKVAKHFIKGGTVDEFVRKIKNDPDWREIRERIPHYAADPEDWGHRVEHFVNDYLPTKELRDLALSGKVHPRHLRKAMPQDMRPTVHGSMAAYNLGDVSGAAHFFGNMVNGMYRALGELPTDHLSRHPFFNSLYKQHINDLHVEAMASAKRRGVQYGPDDLEKLASVARKRALHDLKRTLFDISAHSHAAHLMRFVSPFFSAHQESLSRWWRIVSDDPSIVRKFQLGFDMPSKVGLMYDTETGEPVKPGEGISANHRIVFRVPEAWGGGGLGLPKGTLDKWLADRQWSLNQNSFNLVLQGGLMNPGVGPLVGVPMEQLVATYPEHGEIEKVARLLNPYQPDSSWDSLIPATVQRTYAAIQKEGSAEFESMLVRNIDEELVSFQKKHGRMPNADESDDLMATARTQTIVDSWLRVGQNALSPAPARPESKYLLIQLGWERLQKQAETEGHDWQWARDRFKEKYGEIYLPLLNSSSNVAGNISLSGEAVAQTKKHRALIGRINPALARMVLGADGEGEYSPAARNWFKNAQMAPGDPATFLSNETPKTAMVEEVVNDGWSKYAAVTGALTAMATEAGLSSWRESEQLTALQRAAVAKLAEDNPLWDNDRQDFNPNEYETYVNDMRQIASNPGLQSFERQDVKALQGYLQLRDAVVAELGRRKEAGLPYTEDAQANQDLLRRYSALVGVLVERFPDFETYMFNGVIERDPLLVADPLVAAEESGLVAAN